MSIKNQMENNIIGGQEVLSKISKSKLFFKDFFLDNSNIEDHWYLCLADFIEAGETTFWYPEKVKKCLEILRKDTSSSFKIIKNAKHEINVGIAEYYRFLKESRKYEHDKDRFPVLSFSNVYHPGYLRLSEYCYANLISPIYDLIRNPKKTRSLNLKNRTDKLIEKKVILFD